MVVVDSQVVPRTLFSSEPIAVTVQGFKSIAESTTIPLGPLTVLAGVNSSGKSSILQPLLMIKQTLDTSYDPGALLLDGANVRISRADQMFTKRPGSNRVKRSFGIEFLLSDDWAIGFTFTQPADKRRIFTEEMTFANTTKGVEPFRITEKLSAATLKRLDATRSSQFTDHDPFKDMEHTWEVNSERCFLEPNDIVVVDEERRLFLGSPFMSQTRRLQSIVSDAIHLPGLRGNPERSYPRTSSEGAYPGQFQDYVASIIHTWQEEKSNELLEVANYLEFLNLTWKVEAREIDDTRVEIRVGRMPHARRGGARDLVNIADVGLGTSQILPVLVALQVASKGQLVILEQPEIHLHPLAQRNLARALVVAARRGVRVIVETHSSLLLRGIQIAVADGDIDPDFVNLHWFTRDDMTGMSRVDSASLDDYGRFGDWPSDFDDTAIDTDGEFLDAVAARLGDD
jgi:hypothetical protein